MKLRNIILLAALGYSIYASKRDKAEMKKQNTKFQSSINKALNEQQAQLDKYAAGGGSADKLFSASFRMELAGIRDALWSGAFWVTLKNLTNSPKKIVAIRLRFKIDGVKSAFAPVMFINQTIPANTQKEIRLSGGNDIAMWENKNVAHSVRDALLEVCPNVTNKTVVSRLIQAQGYNWNNIATADVDIALDTAGLQNVITKTLTNVHGVVTYLNPEYRFAKYGKKANGYNIDDGWEFGAET